MIPKKISTRFSHDPEVGVKCSWIRGSCGQPGLDRWMFVGAVVVQHDVQLAPGADPAMGHQMSPR
jgi:hypothetical protein